MRVLVLGGYGLIGSAVVDRLLDEGLQVIGLGRRVDTAKRRRPEAEWRKADLADLRRPENWRPLIADVDVIVNAAGVLQQGLFDDVSAVQETAMLALYEAASAARIQRFVQISAVGVSANAATPFLRTKARADAALAAASVDYVIIRPGLVISPAAYGGGALLRGLAAFPFFTPLVLAEASIQTVWIGDVADTVAKAVTGRIPRGAEFDLVERPERSLRETLGLIRAWLREPQARGISLPRGLGLGASAVADALSWLGWRSPLRSTAMRVLRDGVRGDGAAGPQYLGRELRTLPETLARLPSSPQERWFARLWLAKPLVLATLSVFWITSGLVGLLRFDEAVAVLTIRGSAPAFAAGAVVAGGVIDIALGLLTLFRPTASLALKGMIVVSLAYLIGAVALAPDLWLDPLGPMVKVVPTMMLALVGLAVLEER